MASQLTDDLVLSHRLIKRRWVQIPKDQQALLDDNAWHETLSRGHHPMLNVPANVLQDVKDLHTRKYAKSTQQAPSSAQRPSTANSAGPRPRSSSRGGPTSSPQQQDGEELPWSSSPVHHLRAQCHLRIPSTNLHQSSSPPENPLKRKAPLQSVDDEPQSSGVNSVGLEIEPPGCVSQVMEPPVNRTALRVIATASAKPEPTPPSAQLPTGTVEGVKESPLAKTRRISETLQYSGNDSSKPVAVIKPSQRPTNRIQDSLTISASVSSSSHNMQSTRGNTNKSCEPKIMSDPAPFRGFTPTFEGRRQERAAQHLVITRTPMPGPSFAPPPAQRRTLAKIPSPTAQSPRRPLQRSQLSLSTSYETFKLAYPDYSRSSRDFVVALLSLKQLRRDRALHEFLYDDFIRAYSSDYFAYVSECSRKQVDKILPGIQWYNENVQDVLYTKKLVRKENLADFLHFHAREAHSIRRALGDSQSTESAVEDSDENMEDALGENEEQEPEVIEMDREADVQASPRFHIESSGPVIRSPRLREQLSFRTDEPTGMVHEIAEQPDGHIHDLAIEGNVHEPLVQADTSRRTPEIHLQSSGAAKVTASPTEHHTLQARTSMTPSSVKSFASQENSRDLLSPILSSSTGASRLATSPNHIAMQTRQSVVISPLQQAKSMASRGPRPVLAADEDSDDEDAFESSAPPLPPPTRPTATPSSSKRSRVVAASRDADDKSALSLVSPTPLPQRVTDPSSTSMLRGLSVDGEQTKDASEMSKLPLQRDIVALSNSQPRTISAEEVEAESSEVSMLPLPRVMGPSSTSRFNGIPIAKKDGINEEADDAFEPRRPKKVKHNVPAPRPTPRPSTAAGRPMPTSTIPAPTPSAPVLGNGMIPQRSNARVSKASSVILGERRRQSAGSSIASSANVPRSKKRLSETAEQRSLRLKAFMEEQMERKKRLFSGTPG
ncbi:hypothetical protein N0V93_001477 [Gnomoniopsis smithogilvyi]|uniref:Uncharacterized protein n=1 Tax=Gnomoniopsis smithogilvyi TaxID=1191159 RepID=A0A9W8Z408_9PEZI|nr:hypothetical protein N0V93_001477 [Gnomoniopsis smithogilvyi]